MKYALQIALFALLPWGLFAQTKQEQALTREQKWLIEKTTAFLKARGNNPSTDLYLKNYTKLIASGIFCKNKAEPVIDLQLQGERLNTSLTTLHWEITNQQGGESYIIERRFDSPAGEFESVGLLQGSLTKAASSNFQFTDANDYPGKTWYRIRIKNQPEIKKLVSVQGYTNTVKIFPNPANRQSTLTVALNQFKTDDQTSLQVIDAMGRIVFTMPTAFKQSSMRQALPALQLAPGIYRVKVHNRFNAGNSSFVIH